mgnify:CR=1 FL=1
MDKSKTKMIIVAILLAFGVWYFFIKADKLEQPEVACDERGGKWTEAVAAVEDNPDTPDVDETAEAVEGYCTEKE